MPALPRSSTPSRPPDPDPFGTVPAFTELVKALANQPDDALGAALSYSSASSILPLQIAAALHDGSALPAASADARFKDEAWRASPAHAWLASQYALTREATLSTVRGAEGLDEATRRKVEFFTEQWLDLWSPSNFLAGNPAALMEAWRSSGQSLVRGFRNYLNDLQRSAKLPTQSDLSAFTVGKDLAVTPGKVVARNYLAEVLQYSPTTERVHACPVVIVSPWIGKYYILDLTERQSFVKHLVDSGFTVFVVSWKNPDASMAEVGFSQYIQDGVLFAKNVAASITGVPDPVGIGYCIGGATLAASQAWLKGARKPAFRAIGLMAAMVDYENCGQIKVFIDERAIRHIERGMEKEGFLTSDQMALSFGTLRARELVWSYAVDNYLLGKTPPPFDLLFWNADGTRMPKAMHTFYLRKLYLENALRVPGAIRLDDVPIDLGRITEDVYLVGTEKDHIAPYSSVYKLHRYVRGDVRFVLASSGHIAGIINPPTSKKGRYLTAPEAPAVEAPSKRTSAGQFRKTRAIAEDRPPWPEVEEWVRTAVPHQGSWWTDYSAWLAARTGPLTSPPSLGNEQFPALGEAPGGYVLER